VRSVVALGIAQYFIFRICFYDDSLNIPKPQ
jgi:hypothetical protein